MGQIFLDKIVTVPVHGADTITYHESKLTFSQKIGEDKLGHYAVSTFLIKKMKYLDLYSKFRFIQNE